MANSSQELAATRSHSDLCSPQTSANSAAPAASTTRQQVISALAGESPHTITLSDPLCHQLAADIALLTYRSTRTNALKVASHALRSSLWVYRDGRWQMIFHQGTSI
jgi:hypothetical protein